MRGTCSLVLALLLSAVASFWPAKAHAVDVGTSEPYREQQFEAWGTSLAWWSNGVGGWNDTQARSEVVNLFFDQANGLGLNYARYNIGGGQNRLLAGNFRPGALVPGWVPTAPTSVSDTSTWQWDWNADPRQRAILDEAMTLGVDIVDASLYSAPFWMTISQDTAGSVTGDDNILQEHVDEFAHYQTEVVKHFHDNLGVRFEVLSPMNEPNATWWQAGGQQEGMHVSRGFNQRLLVEAVGNSLAQKGLDTGVVAPDEFASSWSLDSYNQFNSYTKSFIKQIDTHTYGGSGNNSSAAMTQLRGVAAADGKKLYQSEYGNNSTTALLGGIGLAERITQDINILGVQGWAYWQVVEPEELSGAGWGLAWAGYDQTDSDYTIRKQYHVMRQFSSHIRPGSHILSTTASADTVAAYDPVTETTTLVVTNSGSSTSSKTFDLLDGAPSYSRVIQTGNSTNYLSLGPASITGSQVSYSAPGPSVTTIVLHKKPNLIQNPSFNLGPSNPGATSIPGNWTATGAASFSAANNTGDGSGGGELGTNTVGSSGAIWQDGIGDSAVDSTGIAYQFSIDALFEEQGFLEYDADTHLALEFYGADGTTLVHSDVLDYATPLRSPFEDSQWRTQRTEIVMAPAGTRFVRPVVRFDNVQSGSNSTVDLDNAYLQTVKYVPRGRHWNVDGNASLSAPENWVQNASTEENSNLYFGPVISQPTTISLTVDETVRSVTFDSGLPYRLTGSSKLIFDALPGETSLIDVRSGVHIIASPVDLLADAQLQLLDSASLSMLGQFDLAGNDLIKQGPGDITFSGGLLMGGGTLSLFAEDSATIALSPVSVLDGTIDVLLTPGHTPQLGETFELVSYTGAAQQFAAISLPNLPLGLDWQVDYGASLLTATIVTAGQPGDFDGDFDVDVSDLMLWQRGGSPDPLSPSDLQDWVDHFGVDSPSVVLTVPEPQSIVPAALLLAAVFRLRLSERRGFTQNS